MSGRLVTLPKKTYCPWNSANVERVLRDERRHAEEQTAIRRLEREQRTASSKGDGGTAPALAHVNLFAEEEAQATRRQLDVVRGRACDAESRTVSKGVLPVYLRQSAETQRDFSSASALPHGRGPCKEDLRKASMDPMQHYRDDEQDEHLNRQLAAIEREFATKEGRQTNEKRKRRRKRKKHKSKREQREAHSASEDSSVGAPSHGSDRRKRKKRSRSRHRHRSKLSRNTNK